MDPAIVSGLVTRVAGFLAAVIQWTRCFMRVFLAEAGTYQWQAGCGFLEAQRLPSDSRNETRKLEDNEIIFMRKTQ